MCAAGDLRLIKCGEPDMAARNPEELGELFAHALNAGDIEALMKLYEPQAALRPSPGQLIQGSGAIRQAFIGFIGMKPRMSLTAKTPGPCGEVALTTSSWK